MAADVLYMCEFNLFKQQHQQQNKQTNKTKQNKTKDKGVN